MADHDKHNQSSSKEMPLADVSNTEWRPKAAAMSLALRMPLADVSNTEWRNNSVCNLSTHPHATC